MQILDPRAGEILKHPGAFLLQALKAFRANQGLLLAGAVAYYALLSIVPLLILIVIAASKFIDQTELLDDAAAAISSGWFRASRCRSSTSCPTSSTIADFIGWILLLTMLFFSSLAFTVLENAMSVIFLHRVAVRRAPLCRIAAAALRLHPHAGHRLPADHAGSNSLEADGRAQHPASSATRGA
jgi:uncharacterized BrkB/YihY/UPF0761 family membrane protein